MAFRRGASSRAIATIYPHLPTILRRLGAGDRLSDINLHALPIGHAFEGYRIQEVLGAGGFGITYLAEETALDRKVAIKEFMPQGFAARAPDRLTVRAIGARAREHFAWGLDRFRKEAMTLVAFEHPNIVAVHRYFEANGTAYLVMQYVEGMPLDALLAGTATLAEPELEELIHPILDGLEQVHAARFLHRDIKPANIYIRKDGRPVLLDFGAARQAFGSESKSITAIVSEGYAPFEQYEAKGDQGPWTDIYAIGAVLYRCIAGVVPPSATERVSARLRGAADPMRSARAAGAGRYSARLLEAIDRALSTMPADRPQSIGELRQVLAGQSRRPGDAAQPARTAEAPATMTAGPHMAAPRHRLPLVAGLAGVLAAGGIAAYFAFAAEPSAPGAVATPHTPPTKAGSAPPASEDTLGERAAQQAVTRAEADLAAIKEAIGRGELVQPKADTAALLGRIEEALRKRPAHVGLQRVGAAARALEADLVQRIAARVKELVEAAERAVAHNYDEALRLVAEAERLDPAAGKAARERIDALRPPPEGETERRDRIGLHLSLGRYHLEQARRAGDEKRYSEARQLAEQAKLQLGRATDALGKDPAPSSAKSLQRDLEVFEQDLARRIAARVTALLREARELVQAGKLDEAAKRLDEAAELAPEAPEIAALRRAHAEARRQP
jgi:serine/threonine protein kinase